MWSGDVAWGNGRTRVHLSDVLELLYKCDRVYITIACLCSCKNEDTASCRPLWFSNKMCKVKSQLYSLYSYNLILWLNKLRKYSQFLCSLHMWGSKYIALLSFLPHQFKLYVKKKVLSYFTKNSNHSYCHTDTSKCLSVIQIFSSWIGWCTR